jgi:radical SAM enzyme (TIGR01210 family)
MRPEVEMLQGGSHSWFDLREQRFVKAETLFLPQGCPDWGERRGARNDNCAFCSLPQAVADYREGFFEGRQVPPDTQYEFFLENLSSLSSETHTLMVFNAGSFLADKANPIPLRMNIVQAIAEHPTIRRFVIESRAELITPAALAPIQEVLFGAKKQLTIRVGVETQDDDLRLKVLRKGHSRKQLQAAVEAMRSLGITSGAYVLLNPAPGLDPNWAVRETQATIDWVLTELEFDETYFGATCVGVGSPLMRAWEKGEFSPATLSMTWEVLQRTVPRYGARVRLLPFEDHPPFLAVPSNHVLGGLPQSLEGARGCDKEFHELLNKFRDSLSLDGLVPPSCDCKK